MIETTSFIKNNKATYFKQPNKYDIEKRKRKNEISTRHAARKVVYRVMYLDIGRLQHKLRLLFMFNISNCSEELQLYIQ